MYGYPTNPARMWNILRVDNISQLVDLIDEAGRLAQSERAFWVQGDEERRIDLTIARLTPNRFMFHEARSAREATREELASWLSDAICSGCVFTRVLNMPPASQAIEQARQFLDRRAA